jgi:hypothetical protein
MTVRGRTPLPLVTECAKLSAGTGSPGARGTADVIGAPGECQGKAIA